MTGSGELYPLTFNLKNLKTFDFQTAFSGGPRPTTPTTQIQISILVLHKCIYLLIYLLNYAGDADSAADMTS